MNTYNVGSIRNVGILSHGGGGKTTLSEAILFNSGIIERMGSTGACNTVMDYEPEEISRKTSISSSVGFSNWDGLHINLIDTPGSYSFMEDTRISLSGVDSAVIIVSAISGIKAETEKVWKFVSDAGLPSIIFVNKMDKETANFQKAKKEIEKAFGLPAVPLYIPMGAEAGFEGVVDLITGKAIRYGKNQSGIFTETDIPPDISELVIGYRKELIEKVAETEDALLEGYLEKGELKEDEIKKGLLSGARNKKFLPLLAGSAYNNIGVKQLMKMISFLPSPIEAQPIIGINPENGEKITRKPDPNEPFSARVFKTIVDPFVGSLSYIRVFSGSIGADAPFLNPTRGHMEKGGHLFIIQGKKYTQTNKLEAGEIGAIAKLKETHTGDTICNDENPIRFDKIITSKPVISVAIEPRLKKDDEKVITSLAKLVEEDPALNFHHDDETKEMILSGMGQLHLEVTAEKLRRKFGVEINMKAPRVPYRETIKKSAEVQGKYKHQTGGHGQYGDTWLHLEPLARGRGFEFVDKIIGGAIPRQFIPAVEKGIVEAMQKGILAGFPVVDIRVTLFDGSYHPVDSSEMAFKMAASLGFKKATSECQSVLLEPAMNIEVSVPDDCLGAAIGDINSRRGRILGVEPQTKSQKIKAVVPLAEMLKYANTLSSLTGARGIYTMTFFRYEEVPPHLIKKIIEEQKTAEQTT
ncbi:MAG: elongation factor G [Nitrospirota bacterium]